MFTLASLYGFLALTLYNYLYWSDYFLPDGFFGFKFWSPFIIAFALYIPYVILFNLPYLFPNDHKNASQTALNKYLSFYFWISLAAFIFHILIFHIIPDIFQ